MYSYQYSTIRKYTMPYQFRVGDRVRFVHRNDSFGKILSEVYMSQSTGGYRVDVMWEGTGQINDWDPSFLVPAEQSLRDDPEVVRSGTMESRKKSRRYFHNGKMIVEQAGLRKIRPGRIRGN
jgi:hypothetical protein